MYKYSGDYCTGDMQLIDEKEMENLRFDELVDGSYGFHDHNGCFCYNAEEINAKTYQITKQSIFCPYNFNATEGSSRYEVTKANMNNDCKHPRASQKAGPLHQVGKIKVVRKGESVKTSDLSNLIQLTKEGTHVSFHESTTLDSLAQPCFDNEYSIRPPYPKQPVNDAEEQEFEDAPEIESQLDPWRACFHVDIFKHEKFKRKDRYNYQIWKASHDKDDCYKDGKACKVQNYLGNVTDNKGTRLYDKFKRNDPTKKGPSHGKTWFGNFDEIHAGETVRFTGLSAVVEVPLKHASFPLLHEKYD